MHAFVSSKYVVIRTPFRHEGLGCESIQFGKPRGDVADDWFDEHSSPSAAHSDAVPLEPELAG
jgi:hypothetical protein